MKSVKAKQMASLLIVLFLGYLGFSLALPLFPPMFLDPNHAILPSQFTPFTRTALLGLLLATYPLGQFFGCPILGMMSDKYGRKKVLLISLLAVVFVYIITALSIEFTMIYLLYASRFVCGLFEGNVVIAQAAITDISEDNSAKSKNFGWLVSISSSGFVFGPLLSGKLANPHLVSWFNYATPFWFASFFVLLAFIFVSLFFIETKRPNPEIKIKISKTFTNVIEGFHDRVLRKIYGANFFIFLAIFFFFTFFSVFLIRRFNFHVSDLAEFNAYLSIPITLAPIFFGVLTKRLSTKQIVISTSILLGINMLIIIFPHNSNMLFITLIPAGIFIACGFTFTALMISNNVNSEQQGHFLGINQSVQVSAEALTGLVGGFLAGYLSSLPLIIGAVFALLAPLFLIGKQQKKPT